MCKFTHILAVRCVGFVGSVVVVVVHANLYGCMVMVFAALLAALLVVLLVVVLHASLVGALV
jgi:hypothetical protein